MLDTQAEATYPFAYVAERACINMERNILEMDRNMTRASLSAIEADVCVAAILIDANGGSPGAVELMEMKVLLTRIRREICELSSSLSS